MKYKEIIYRKIIYIFSFLQNFLTSKKIYLSRIQLLYPILCHDLYKMSCFFTFIIKLIKINRRKKDILKFLA